MPAPAPSPNGFMTLSQAEQQQQQLIAQLPALHAVQLPFMSAAVNGTFAGAPNAAFQFAQAPAALAPNAASNAIVSASGGLLLPTSPAALAALQQHMKSMQELNVNAPPYTGPSALQMQARAAATQPPPQSVLLVNASNGGGLQSVPSMSMCAPIDSNGSSFGCGGASGSESSADSGTAAFFPQASAAALASDQVRVARSDPPPGPSSWPSPRPRAQSL